MSREEDMGLVSEESSSYPDESGLELGLSLGGGGGGGGKKKLGFGSDWGQYARILTAKDFPSSSSLSSSSSSGPVPTSPPAPSNQVVGWPPISASRINSMVNQAKYPSCDEFQPTVEKCKIKNVDIDMNSCEGDRNYIVKEEGKIKKSNFVKVNKDGNGIGRKVDLSAHSCYETLVQTMEGMFSGAGTRSTVSSKLLDGSSEFVLTYEDKDGDWMLVGDVPWGMFINSVKRLRIMRTSEANGLGSKFQGGNIRQSHPI